jgi:DNA repair exonuclease SbcCD nuclease subunit
MESEMTVLVFSDLHLDEDSAEVVLGRILPTLRQTAQDADINQAIMLGDWWHVRYRVDIRLLNAVRDELKQWEEADITLRILPGNHDQVDRAGRNALEVFDEYRKVKVYTEPTADGDGVWVPYRKRAEDVGQAVEQLEPRSMNLEGNKVCFAHAPIQGAWMNEAKQDTDGLSQQLFQKFDRVLLGHYHKRQTWTVDGTTFWYVGSVREVNASEMGQDKGYGIWDGNHLNWCTMDWAPRIHKLELKKGESLDTTKIRPGDDVRIVAGPGVDIEQLGQYLEQLQVKHTVTPEVETTQLRLDVPATASLAEYAQAYVERTAPKNADKARLMQTFHEIVGKATA